MQSAAVLGIYGLTLLAVLVFALPPVLWSEAPPGRRGGARGEPRWRSRCGAARRAGGGGPGAAGDGAARAIVPGVKIRIVQPSVPQREKWRPENQRAHLPRSHASCRRPTRQATTDNLAGITHVIWPEAAMPFLPLDYPDVRAAIGRPAAGGDVSSSPARCAPSPRRPARRGRGASSTACWCSARAARWSRSTTRSTWCRSASICRCSGCSRRSGCEQLTRLRGGFDTGVAPRPLLRVPGLPAAAPLICYEAIFPRAVVQGRGAARR